MKNSEKGSEVQCSKSKSSESLDSSVNSFEEISCSDLTDQEFQDIFDVVKLLIRVQNRLRSERLSKPKALSDGSDELAA